jgi:hypothetical protein
MIGTWAEIFSLGIGSLLIIISYLMYLVSI